MRSWPLCLRREQCYDPAFYRVTRPVVGEILFRRLFRLRLWALARSFQHLIEFLLLIIVQHTTDLGDGGFAQRADLLHLIVAGERVVGDDRRSLLALIDQHRLDLSLLIGIEVQFQRQGVNLVVNARRLGGRRGRRRLSSLGWLALGWLSGLRFLRRLRGRSRRRLARLRGLRFPGLSG